MADVHAYRPPLSFPSQAKVGPLEQEQLKFVKQVNGIPINTPFIECLAQVPEYAKFLQVILDIDQQLEKTSKVILSDHSSRVILGKLLKKMGDPGHLTLPFEFGNNTKTYVLADSRESMNIMLYSFYQKLSLPDMEGKRT